MRIAFLGPEASFTSLAAEQIFKDKKLIPYSSILDCFKAVASSEVEKAIVPLENSIEGTVSMTLDYLFSFENIVIEAEAVMPISHHLMIHPDTRDFDKVLSHPQALAQCFHFLDENYNGVERLDYHSTSAAAKYISQNPELKIAAIANSYAADYYGLKIIHENIHDFEQNHTKFIVISKEKSSLEIPLEPASEKTSMIITLPDDHAGGLHQVLSVFAWRKMNLSKIESRTLKTGLGKYFFFINVVSEWNEILSRNALEELAALGATVQFLGHYQEFILKD